MNESLKQDVIDYIRNTCHCGIEYLWVRYPDTGIFRHQDNQKWFALMTALPREKLGLPGQDAAWVLNVKVRDMLMKDLLLRQEGFLPGYHMSKGTWVSILLDGTVSMDEITRLIDDSFRVTASAETKKALRAPKEWLIPSNPRYFDIVRAFDLADEIDWKQGKGIKTGDTVYMYVGSPISAILYRCLVTQTDVPWHYEQDGLTIFKLMKIRLLKRYDPEKFSLDVLKEKYAVYTVRGPRGVPQKLSDDLKME